MNKTSRLAYSTLDGATSSRRASMIAQGSQSIRRNATQRTISTAEEPVTDPLAPRFDQTFHDKPRSHPLHPRNLVPVPGEALSPTAASAHLSKILNLPASRSFPPDLAARIVTHKSWVGTLNIGEATAWRGNESTEQNQRGRAAHNEKLAFLGKRAFESYMLMFLLEAERTLGGKAAGKSVLGVLENKEKELGLKDKVANLGHLNNLGRVVAGPMQLDSVMRWTSSGLVSSNRKLTDQAIGLLKVSGEVTQALLGATLMQFGSPAAQRLFHIHYLPKLSPQLKSQGLRELVEKAKVKALKEGVVVEA